MGFPRIRMRRLRSRAVLRDMVSETDLKLNDLVYPLFVLPGEGLKREIEAMPGNYRMSVDVLAHDLKEVRHLGIPAILIFGIPEKKDPLGSEAYSDDGVVQRAVRAVKEEFPELLVITDVCLCQYTSHGHCGYVNSEGGSGYVDNDRTLELLSKTALSHVKAGADVVAPSDMMDGRVRAIRSILDDNGFTETPILSYSAKYASSFYGPFREAAESAPQFGDRKTYQMDYRNADEALREVELDIEEGADIVMIKPALPYLDIIYRVKSRFGIPVAAYNVSGEYSIIKAGAERGYIDEKGVMMETLYAIRRAGADLVITYFAKEAAGILAR